jgi:ABC-type multidrug transport system permease subunit
MLRTLLAKDLRRAIRNPVPWIISLAIPFIITALIGTIFGPKTGGGGLGTIHIALVDEDNTGLGEFLQGSLEQMRTGGQREAPPFDMNVAVLDRAEAVRRTTWGEFAAVVVLPAGFTDGYFSADGQVAIELIKNPAQAIHPRIIEEILGLLVTVLNGIRDLAGDQLGDVRDLIESDDDVLTKLALGGMILVEARDRLEPVKRYLAPPLVTYTEETRKDNQATGPGFNIFAFLMAGMAAMFLLYLIDHAMRDLYREMRARTLERFKTLHEGLFAFLAGKVLFAIAMGMIGAVILLGGSALIFQFAWRQPVPLALLVLAYSFCGAGVLGLMAALAGSERRADALGNVLIMGMAMLGGCMFPIDGFPRFVREWITPLMPTGWFASAARSLEAGGDTSLWLVAIAKLLILGLATVALAAFLVRRRLARGVHA